MQFIRIRFIKPRGHGLVVHVHLAPDMTGDPVTLVTPPHTDQCDYCMCIRLENKHNESKPFRISDQEVSFIPLNCTNNNAKSSVSKFKQE